MGEFFRLHVGLKALALQDLYNDVARGHSLFDSRIARPAAADALAWRSHHCAGAAGEERERERERERRKARGEMT